MRRRRILLVGTCLLLAGSAAGIRAQERLQPVSQVPDFVGGGGDVETAKLTVNVTSGPYGLAVYPSGGTSVAGAPPAGTPMYNYPSLLLAISATPVRTPAGVGEAMNNGDTVKNVDGENDITWMDATSDLTALDANGRLAVCRPGPCIRIIGMAPGNTVAYAVPRTVALIADSTSKVAASVAPAAPAAGTLAATAAAGAQVLFDNLFPPKDTALQYPYLDNSDPTKPAFGWYFRANPAATPPTSLLGMQMGEVMLQVDPGVAAITVSSRALSQWKNPPDPAHRKNRYLYSASTQTITILKNGINYAQLKDLTQFPMLILKEDVEKILHIRDAEYAAMIKTPNPQLVTPAVNSGYVTKASLLKYLGASQ